jgi:phage baseplate assembly protein W
MAIRVRKKYDFKSVGISRTPIEDQPEVEEEKQGLSFKTPLAAADESFGSTFETYTDVRDVVRDNLRNLLSTNYGERLGEYDLGANLVEFVAELEAGASVDTLIGRIVSTIGRWMSYVQVEDVQVTKIQDDPALAEYVIRVIYTAPDLFAETDAVVVSFAYL